MIITSPKEKYALIFIYSLLAYICVCFIMYWLLQESASVLLPIVFVSVPWIVTEALAAAKKTSIKVKYWSGVVFWLVCNAINWLILVQYYSLKYGEKALYYVMWEEMICSTLISSLLQLTMVFLICGSDASKLLKNALIIVSMVAIMLCSSFLSLLYNYYCLHFEILHYILLGVSVIFYIVCGVIETSRLIKKHKGEIN
ncbi:MAG: hypothetical protein IJY39_12645 [Clostridia bacterium]|nr:hypothetical protein [Clostridia bacterium]